MIKIARDCFGQFAPIDLSSDQLKVYNQIQIELREKERQKKKDAKLSWNESGLLFQLVDHFEPSYYLDPDKYPIDNIKRYKRKPYNQILLNHRISRNNLVKSKFNPDKKLPNNNARSGFSRLVNHLVSVGWIQKIKHGHNLYLRISEDGLKKIICHYEYYRRII